VSGNTATKKKPTLTKAQKTLDNFGNAESGLGATLGGTAGTTKVPGVTTADASDIVPFTLPNQKADFTPTGNITTKTAGGGTQMTFSNWVDAIHQLQGDKAALTQIQTQMKAAGYYTSKSWSSYGTLDSATVNAWKQLGLDAVGSNITATSLLAAGENAPNLVTDMNAVQEKINAATEAADSATSSSVSLTDPNKIIQTLETAADSMGINLTQDQLNQFANAFINGPQGEVAAETNEINQEKANDSAGAKQLTTALGDLKSGNVAQANAAENATGPTSVATKAAPDLDAEAIATAKSINPAMYDATQSSDLYGLIQRALGGSLQQPTSPSSPTSQAASGLIATTPIAGAP
jgi:hypothetical protein